MLDVMLCLRWRRRRRAWLAALILMSTPGGAAQAATRHALVLYSYQREFAPHVAFAASFRPALTQALSEPIDFVETSVQAIRASRSAADTPDLNRLRAMFGGQAPDIVVTVGGPAAVFAQRFRAQLFPATPLLMADVDRRFVRESEVTGRDTVVAVQHDPSQMVDQILRLLPDTRTIVVVIGTSQLEQFWLEQTKREFRRFDGRVRFEWTDDLAYADLLERCSTLPPHSAILYGVLSLDAKGEPHVEARTLADLDATANAPMFGLHSGQLGRGIVGGPLLAGDQSSRTAADVAVRLLRGESPRGIAMPVQLPSVPTFDWRKLRRWGIDQQRLPGGSIIRFRQPSPWERHKSTIIAAGALAGVQALVVVALVLNLAKRRRDERSAPPRDERPPLIEPAIDVSGLRRTQAALSRLSRWLMRAREQEQAALSRKVQDDICQRMVVLTLQVQSTEPSGSVTNRDAVSRQLSNLAGDMLSLSDPVYRRLDLLGLTAVAANFCDDLAAHEGYVVDFRHEAVPPDLPPDVALALFRVLQEAAANAVKHAHVRDLWVALRATTEHVCLEVTDTGTGFDPDAMLDRGVGLTAMRERVGLVGGECAIESRSGFGTRVRASVPLQQGEARPVR